LPSEMETRLVRPPGVSEVRLDGEPPATPRLPEALVSIAGALAAADAALRDGASSRGCFG